MIRSTIGAAGLAAVLALSAATVAFAQSPSPGGPPPGGMRMMEMKRPDPEVRAQRLRDVLQLTPAQEPALKAFLAAQKPPGPPAPPERRDKARTTPERLDQQRARMVEHLAAFDRRAAATRTFYAQLTPGQKTAFDALSNAGRGRREVRIERRMMSPGPDSPPMELARPQ
ncbi:Spy/CpxP family protein refolding chaperone [Phenylobacterium sp.]|uniref:Spy/CpxP family protein refolding chaperone n=1 Tax=Phenylobacterium sp. TaxID=1871053 RepID=UPI0025E3B0E4|nr:Spy/CpxP family protein refolding chaperone [Phenylobacterium sp.]MCA6286448.1 Spy/CpxP family protein refolding chaperone [Phenylobacterium sp.]MCA6289924.1 Spy/CpxP family protein refolding chaperone [Phenylobacterium sp.]MCA6309263.1 Spy/CpxP family protein refolding chaperone [Phenylobacterium sp.]MCA6322917.1 Spy/CpxP family protein refolding chaperone [Phenylobacterium sp.]MCA6336824.1 Spy/CpxP family protein refolding chaperone [Phenylobacterium sp.]